MSPLEKPDQTAKRETAAFQDTNWERLKKYSCYLPDLKMLLDYSRMNFPAGFLEKMEPAMQKAYAEMKDLEAGAQVNRDEKRAVGHYWLRTPYLAPDAQTAADIEKNSRVISEFAARIHGGETAPEPGKRYKNFLLIGIGGSALGPQLLCDALKPAKARMKAYFLDNTDPDGIDRIFDALGKELKETLTIVVSKSGGTVETRNGAEEARYFYRKKGLDFSQNAVAVTMEGSMLDRQARDEKWLACFPMWDWVGGRTSVMSAVGLLPAALVGINIEEFLRGAQRCDEYTRTHNTRQNPAALMALMWYYATGGTGERALVLLPYKDSLRYLSRYLQQLVMESLGKERDRDGNKVCQGLTVYGNKGSTDQHSYVQQLADGLNNFFVTFIGVLADERQHNVYLPKNITSGDYLRAFLLGTRRALSEKGRESLTLTVRSLDAFTLGALIALFERTVGYYASLINVNAYNQPGVEAGKKGAGVIIDLLAKTVEYLKQREGKRLALEEIAGGVGTEDLETMFQVMEILCADRERKIVKEGSGCFDGLYFYRG